jgi:hypothetical protein
MQNLALQQAERTGRSGRVNLWRTIYELAGTCGLDPDNLTLRELVWAAESRSRQEWARSSLICAILANANRDPKSKPFTPDDFSPYKQEKPKPVKDTKAAFEMLKAMAGGRIRKVNKCQQEHQPNK